MEDAIELCRMAVNNYILHLYYLNDKITKTVKKRLKKRAKRRSWMSAIHKNRTPLFLDNMFTELTSEPDNFFNFFSMSTSDFEILLQKLAPYITKQDTTFRTAIPAKVRLAMALRYLVTGDNFRILHCLFKVSHQLISKIVHEVCAAILIVLKNEIKMPVNEQDWLEKEADFCDIFPHCLAAMDGKNVILSQKNYGSVNRPTSGIALLTLVDRNCHFIYADVEHREKSREGVFQNSSLFMAIESNTLKLPSQSTLTGSSDHVMPYVFVADNGFPLHTNIMKPYPNIQEGVEVVFNRQLSAARIVAENAFGVMTVAFQVLGKPIPHHAERAKNIVMSCVLLHNFLMKSTTSKKLYAPPGYIDSISDGLLLLGSSRNDQPAVGALKSLPAVTKQSAVMPMEIRDKFAEYFATLYN